MILILLCPLISINAYGYTTEEVKKFTLEPLPYAYDALEPYIDKETMTLHHDKHHQAYVDNLNKALEKYPALYNKSLVELLSSPNKIPADVRTSVLNNAGGDYNHNFFWSIMGPNKGGVPTGDLATAIDRDFGSFDKFKESFSNAALGRFGSGWAWLLSDKNGKLSIVSTANQDTPIPLNLTPIIAIDVWEHAYYLKYQNRRNEYIENWWNVVNWDNALTNYTKRK
ncbi:MAG: superoxide dismutase [Clostridium sp.]|uniref:superoxide dismutase n=1 Tax=Clostridium sp. TaxID=1506 RepID=UPI003045E591